MMRMVLLKVSSISFGQSQLPVSMNSSGEIDLWTYELELERDSCFYDFFRTIVHLFSTAGCWTHNGQTIPRCMYVA